MNLKSLWRKTSTWLHVFDLAVWFSYYIWFSSFLTVVKMKSKHTGIWIIHVKLNFFTEKKKFSWDKRKENNWTDFLWGNEIIELCIKNNVYV